MKRKKFSTKLALNKATISNLGIEEKRLVKGAEEFRTKSDCTIVVCVDPRRTSNVNYCCSETCIVTECDVYCTLTQNVSCNSKCDPCDTNGPCY